MKKLFLIGVVLMTVQTGLAQKFTVGLKGGANLSNFTGGNFSNVKKNALLGFHAGGFFQFRLSRIAFQSEAMVSTQGAVIDSVSGSYNWKVTYVNVPVLLQVFVRKRIYLEAGVQAGFKLGEDFENNSLQDFANDLDLSLAGGLGYRTKRGFGLGFRYTAGFSKVGDYQPSNGIDPDFKNGVAQLSLYIPLARSGK